MAKMSPKQVKLIRFVLGPILIVSGLYFWNFLLAGDMHQVLIEAYQAGGSPDIDFTFMLKGIAPFVVILAGIKLVTWKSLGTTDE